MIYFIQARESGRIKIGYTAGDPTRRLAALQTGCPEPLDLLAAIDGDQAKEKELHILFADARLAGEWFRPTDDVLGVVEQARAGAAAVTREQARLSHNRWMARREADRIWKEQKVAEDHA